MFEREICEAGFILDIHRFETCQDFASSCVLDAEAYLHNNHLHGSLVPFLRKFLSVIHWRITCLVLTYNHCGIQLIEEN